MRIFLEIRYVFKYSELLVSTGHQSGVCRLSVCSALVVKYTQSDSAVDSTRRGQRKSRSLSPTADRVVNDAAVSFDIGYDRRTCACVIIYCSLFIFVCSNCSIWRFCKYSDHNMSIFWYCLLIQWIALPIIIIIEYEYEYASFGHTFHHRWQVLLRRRFVMNCVNIIM